MLLLGLKSARGGHLEVGGGQARRRAEGLHAGSGGLEPIVQAQREDDVGQLRLPHCRVSGTPTT